MLGFGALMAFDTMTQISFKLAAMHAGEFQAQWAWLSDLFTNRWVYMAIVGYLGAFVTWMTLLKHAPIGPSFAASHMEVIPVLAISYVLFNERFTLIQLLGCLCILAGVACLSLSQADARKQPSAQRDC